MLMVTFFLVLQMIVFSLVGRFLEKIIRSICKKYLKNKNENEIESMNPILIGMIFGTLLGLVFFRVNLKPYHLLLTLAFVAVLNLTQLFLSTLKAWKTKVLNFKNLNFPKFYSALFLYTIIVLALINRVVKTDIPIRTGSDSISYFSMMRILNDGTQSQIFGNNLQLEASVSKFDFFVSENFIAGNFPRFPSFYLMTSFNIFDDPSLVSSLVIASLILAIILVYQVLCNELPNHKYLKYIFMFYFVASPVYLPSIRDGFYSFLLALPFFTYLLINSFKVQRDSAKIFSTFSINLIFGLTSVFIYADLFPMVLSIFVFFCFQAFFAKRYTKSQIFAVTMLQLTTFFCLTDWFADRIFLNIFQRTSELGTNGYPQLFHITLFDTLGLNFFWNSLTWETSYTNHLLNLVLFTLSLIISLILIRWIIISSETIERSSVILSLTFVLFWITTNLVMSFGDNNYSHFRMMSLFSPFVLWLILKALSPKLVVTNKDHHLLFLTKSHLFIVFPILIFSFSNHNLSVLNHAQNFDYITIDESRYSDVLKLPFLAKDYGSVIQLSSYRNVYWVNRNQEILNNTLSDSPGKLFLIINSKNTSYRDCLKSSIEFREVGRGGSAVIPINMPVGGEINEIELHSYIAKAFPFMPIRGDRDKSLSCI